MIHISGTPEELAVFIRLLSNFASTRDEIKQSLPDQLLSKRKEKRVTQQQLADAIGVCRSAIANWETGQQIPSTRSLIALADFFGCSLNDLTECVKMPSKADALAGSWRSACPARTKRVRERGGERMTAQVQEALEKQLQLLSERSQGDEIMPDELYQLSQAMVLIAGHLAGL